RTARAPNDAPGRLGGPCRDCDALAALVRRAVVSRCWASVAVGVLRARRKLRARSRSEVIWLPAGRRRGRCPRSRIVRVDEDRQRRVAENEAMSREANEAIEKALW